MDQQSLLQSLRLRTAQLLTWFIGSTQTQQQYSQSDRQQRDGLVRSLDDPDARQRQTFMPDASLSLRERFQALGGSQAAPSDTQARQQQWFAQQALQQQRLLRGGGGYGR